jgi:ABC-type phosphate transport system substrate-binding protein
MPLPAILEGPSITRLLQGACAGALATVLVGFGWGGWMLGSTAKQMAVSSVGGLSKAQHDTGRDSAGYEAVTGVKIDYQAVGSDVGIRQIKSRTVDFGASVRHSVRKNWPPRGSNSFQLSSEAWRQW